MITGIRNIIPLLSTMPHLSSYTFIALDLETTGLDPQKETIMEIAAIRFQLEKDGETFRVINTEERSMLIDPERELRDEIRMITGITSAMLQWKEKWKDVQERVRLFIGDSIIVGHNVLFDIAMLWTHGIDLSRHCIFDTFELSEIFSQDAESLNLMYLASQYDIEITWEHRALDDTKLSVWLFIHYLSQVARLSTKWIQIFSHFLERDISMSLRTLLEICEKSPVPWYSLSLMSESQKSHTQDIFFPDSSRTSTCMSLWWSLDEELDLFQKAYEQYWKILLITNWKKQSLYWKKILEIHGYKPELIIEAHRYCSMEMLQAYIRKSELSRKEIIFYIKMLFWIEKTASGLLEELKYYGDERHYLELLRSEEDEYSPFRHAHESRLEDTSVLIGDAWMKELRKKPVFLGSSTTIFRDIGELEDIIRRSDSIQISFSKLAKELILLRISWALSFLCVERIELALAYFQDLLENIHTRPTGISPYPPWEYGETYYFDQQTLWHHGEKWLSIITDFLDWVLINEQERIWNLWQFSAIEWRIFWKVSNSLKILIQISRIQEKNLGIILNITWEDTVLSIIPRDTSQEIQKFIQIQWGNHTIVTGYGIEWPIMNSFLRQQCGMLWVEMMPAQKDNEKILHIELDFHALIRANHSIVFLSTNNKHLRTLTEDLKKKFSEIKFFTQGISGGKWKILSLFREYWWKKILLWIIDTWIDESSLWESCDTVILAKIPFDPPTDPYYLARTVWMRNNFEEYSCPLAINTTNTLISRVRSGNPNTVVYCIDERLLRTPWWQRVLPEIL